MKRSQGLYCTLSMCWRGAGLVGQGGEEGVVRASAVSGLAGTMWDQAGMVASSPPGPQPRASLASWLALRVSGNVVGGGW